MSTDARLLALVDSGHELMARERALLRRGDFAGAAELAASKQALLAALEEAMARSRATGSVRRALAALIEDGRRNERLILSARRGLSLARRRIDAIIATLRGAVAYDREGQSITSRDDAAQKSSRA